MTTTDLAFTEEAEYCYGETATATWHLAYTEHLTAHDDGRYTFTGTARGDITWTQREVDFTARFTTSFSMTSSRQVETVVISLHGTGRGSDGTRVRLAELAKATVHHDGRVLIERLDDVVHCTAPRGGKR